MGLVGKILSSAARGAGQIIAIEGLSMASEAMDNATKSVGNVIEKHRIKRDNSYIASHPNNTYLYLQLIETGLSADMRVFDQEGDEPYSITGTVGKPMFSFKVKRGARVVGTVKKELLALRVPLVHERSPINLNVTTEDGSTFTVKTKLTPNGRRYDVEPCGWRIQSLTKLISDFTAKKDDEMIFRVSRRSGYEVPTYLLDFEDEVYADLALLISLGIIYDNCFGG